MSNKKLIKEIILERNPNAMFLRDKFDEALIGSSIQCGNKHVATYDSNKCLDILIEESDFDENEAYENFLFATEQVKPNINAPIIFSDFKNIKKPDLPDICDNMTIDDLP